MGKSFEAYRPSGYVEPVTRRSTRMAELTRAIIDSLNEAEPITPITEEEQDEA